MEGFISAGAGDGGDDDDGFDEVRHFWRLCEGVVMCRWAPHAKGCGRISLFASAAVVPFSFLRAQDEEYFGKEFQLPYTDAHPFVYFFDTFAGTCARPVQLVGAGACRLRVLFWCQ
jgi:hypothetical protein